MKNEDTLQALKYSVDYIIVITIEKHLKCMKVRLQVKIAPLEERCGLGWPLFFEVHQFGLPSEAVLFHEKIIPVKFQHN